MFVNCSKSNCVLNFGQFPQWSTFLSHLLASYGLHPALHQPCMDSQFGNKIKVILNQALLSVLLALSYPIRTEVLSHWCWTNSKSHTQLLPIHSKAVWKLSQLASLITLLLDDSTPIFRHTSNFWVQSHEHAILNTKEQWAGISRCW